MKKNISINISGIIFHIEEDGYDKLKSYLNSIHQYFSSYEESAEIIADIENRIAEIFLSKLGQNKQVIMAEDVQELIATMGTIADFEAIEGEQKQTADYSSSFNFESEPTYEYNKAEESAKKANNKKQLYRDTKRKLIAGVAAGIAHYFSIDPLWVRLAFAATFLGVFGAELIPAIALISYIALWIITPVSDSLPEDTKIKKLFRNPERHILGGVASGLSSYFGADETIIRLLFVLGIPLGGASVIIYLILWAITPEAKTLTDRMQMEGEPVTLSNIEKKIKESFNIAADDDENIFAKILVFPFKLIAKFFSFLTENFRPLGNFFLETIRVLSGSFLTLISFATVVALMVMLAVVLGVFSVPAASNAHIDGLPLNIIRQSVPMWGVISLLIVLIVPFFTLGLAGVSIIARRKIINTIAAWSLFGVWILGLIGASATIPSFVQSFQVEGTQKSVLTYKADAALLKLGLSEQHDGLEFVKLTIRGYDGKEIKLVQKTEARGSNQEEANINAQSVDYKVVYLDSTLIFDKGLLLRDKTPFRAQNINIELFIPYNKEFIMKKELSHILSHTLHPFGYGQKDLGNENKWVFNENGLKCLTCPEKDKEDLVDTEDVEISINEEDFSKEMTAFKDFKKVLISNSFEVEIEQGNEYRVVINGEKKLVDNVKVSQEKSELFISFAENNLNLNENSVKVYITMPSLTDLNLKSTSNTHINGFKEREMNIILADRAECIANIEAQQLKIVMKDRTDLTLTGKGDVFSVILTDRAEIKAFDFEADKVEVIANDRSNASVFANKTISINATNRSEVAYKGKPKVVSSTGDFKRED